MGIKKPVPTRIHTYGIGLLVLATAIGGYITWYTQHSKPVPILTAEEISEQVVIEEWYAPLFPMMIDTVAVQASVASTTKTRTQGLSKTPYLPSGVVKLFVFDQSEEWSFWMKDMEYAIDIIWVNAAGKIVHIEESALPSSYPKSFVSSSPAKYVVETAAGFVQAHKVELGDTVVVPTGL